jgi:hypothetical protein
LKRPYVSVLESDTNRKITVIGANKMLQDESPNNPEYDFNRSDDGFEVQSLEDTMQEFADKSEVLADGVIAYTLTCQHCDSDIVAINQLPQLFMLNVCYGSGEIFSSQEVCANCVFDILTRGKSQPLSMNLQLPPSE